MNDKILDNDNAEYDILKSHKSMVKIEMNLSYQERTYKKDCGEDVHSLYCIWRRSTGQIKDAISFKKIYQFKICFTNLHRSYSYYHQPIYKNDVTKDFRNKRHAKHITRFSIAMILYTNTFSENKERCQNI